MKVGTKRLLHSPMYGGREIMPLIATTSRNDELGGYRLNITYHHHLDHLKKSRETKSGSWKAKEAIETFIKTQPQRNQSSRRNQGADPARPEPRHLSSPFSRSVFATYPTKE